MEGLMLAHALRELRPLPLRALGWAFPDETTAALLLEGFDNGPANLVIAYRPPEPLLYVSKERMSGAPKNAFQHALSARLRGELTFTAQLQLDRVAMLGFSGERGFVDVPPARLLFETTGRNANLLILEEGEGFSGKIRHAAREITSSRNRFRTTRSGGLYTPPPPYKKHHPAEISRLSDAKISELAALPLLQWRSKIDGLGPLLAAELCRRAGFADAPDSPEKMDRALAALASLISDPSVQAGELTGGVRAAADAAKAEKIRKELRSPLQKQLSLQQNQLADVHRAEEGLLQAESEREQANTLMAFAHQVPVGSALAVLPRLDGEGELSIEINPMFSAVQNAERLYARAKRREAVHKRLQERLPQLQAQLAATEAHLQTLDGASLPELSALVERLRQEKPEKSPYGTRFVLPSGLVALVGRSSRENATLTHRVGRSNDWWFHAQGYAGSHVLVKVDRAGRELDLPDILHAAQLAAHFSKARGDDNVAVDYTRIKHVWRPKGAAAGAVHYSNQKTVYVSATLPEA